MRSGFTLIEILVMIVIVGILGTMSINSGVQSQQRAVFQANFQEVVLAAQDMRTRAVTNNDETIKGYGLTFINDGDTVIMRTFIDKDGNGNFNNGDEVIEDTDLFAKASFAMGMRYYPYSDNAKFFDSDSFNTKEAAVTYISNSYEGCHVRANDGNSMIDVNMIEYVFGYGTQTDNFDEIEEYNQKQYLTVHKISCINEVSNQSLIQ